MPELPEVEYGRKVASAVASGRHITAVRCADDRIVFDELAPREIARRLTGRRVEDVQRKGKYLWFCLDQGPHPLFHFGMTGAFRVRGEDPLPLENGPRVPDRSWPPKFTKIHFEFEGGNELVMTNARRLGRIRMRVDPLAEPPLSQLGFDPLYELPAPAEFRGRVQGRHVTLKGLLLDQGFAAGVGNWMADEILYRARLDPRRAASSLSTKEIDALRRALAHVVDTSVAVDADKTRLPRSWLFHHRWGKKAGGTTAAGEPIQHLTVAGRTTAWVPGRQR